MAQALSKSIKNDGLAEYGAHRTRRLFCTYDAQCVYPESSLAACFLHQAQDSNLCCAISDTIIAQAEPKKLLLHIVSSEIYFRNPPTETTMANFQLAKQPTPDRNRLSRGQSRLELRITTNNSQQPTLDFNTYEN